MNKFRQTCCFAAALIFEAGSLHATDPELFSPSHIKTYMETAAKSPHNHFLSSYEIPPFPPEQLQMFYQYFPYFCDFQLFAKILKFYQISSDPYLQDISQLEKKAEDLSKQIQQQKEKTKKDLIDQLARKKEINTSLSLIVPLCVQPVCFTKNSIVSHSTVCWLERLQPFMTCIRPDMRELFDVFQKPDLKKRAKQIFNFDEKLAKNFEKLLNENIQCIQLKGGEDAGGDVAIICVLKQPVSTVHYQSQFLVKCDKKTVHDAEVKTDNALIIRSKQPYGGVSAYFTTVPSDVLNEIVSSAINAKTNFVSVLQQLPFESLKKLAGNDLIASLFNQEGKIFGSQSFTQELFKSIIQSLKNHFWHFWWERFDVSTPFQYYGKLALSVQNLEAIFSQVPQDSEKKCTLERNKKTYNVLLKIAELENDPNYAFETFSMKLDKMGKEYKWSNRIVQGTGNIDPRMIMNDFLLYENRMLLYTLLCQNTSEIAIADDLYANNSTLVSRFSKQSTNWFELTEFNLFFENMWSTIPEMKVILQNAYEQQTKIFDLMRKLKTVQRMEQDILCFLKLLQQMKSSVSLYLEKELSAGENKILKDVDAHKKDLWEFLQKIEQLVEKKVYPGMVLDQKALQTVFLDDSNIFTQSGQEINNISLPRNSYGNDVYDLRLAHTVPVIYVNNKGDFCVTGTQIIRSIFDFNKCITFFPILPNAQSDIDRFNIGKNNVQLVCSAPVNGAQKHQTMLTVIKEYLAEIKKEFDKVAKVSAKKGLANKGKKGRK